MTAIEVRPAQCKTENRSLETPEDNPGGGKERASRLEEEFGLLDVARLLYRGRLAFLVTFLAALAVGAAYYGFADKVYEGRAVIEIGRVASGEPLVAPALFVARLEEGYIADGKRLPDHDGTDLHSIHSKKDARAVVELTARGGDPHRVLRFLREATGRITETQQAAFQAAFRHSQQKLAAQKAQADGLRGQAERLNEVTDRIGEAEPAIASRLLFERNKLLKKARDIEAQVLDLSAAFSGPGTYGTRVIAEPYATNRGRPLEPDLRGTATAALTIGFILGVLAALVIGLRARMRSEGVP